MLHARVGRVRYSPAAVGWALVNVAFALVPLLASVAHVAGLAVGAALGYRLRTATTVKANASSS